jgi:hypothetical protein
MSIDFTKKEAIVWRIGKRNSKRKVYKCKMVESLSMSDLEVGLFSFRLSANKWAEP